MEMKVVKIEANSIMDLINAITSGEFDKTLKEPKEFVKKESTVSVKEAINNIAKKRGWTFDETDYWLTGIAEFNISAALSIVLKELALELDKKYKDHIEDSEKIFVVSMLDGRIHEVPKNNIKNYRNFAAFRTLEDAKEACRVLRIPLKKMFKGVKKQKD